MKSYIYCILFFILSLYSNQIKAQIVTDRPDQTESSSTVGKGNLQIESGFLVGFEGESFSSVRQLLAPTTLFRFGITKGIELRLLSQYETLKQNNFSVQGISDFEVGTKIQLYQKEGAKTEVAFLSHLVFPSGTNELTGNIFGSINKLSIAHEISDKVGLGYNIGYNYFDSDKGDLTYSIALGISVNNKVGVYIEPYGEFIELEESVLNFDAGFTYLANENLQFDFSFGTGISHRMNYISVGVSWLILSN